MTNTQTSIETNGDVIHNALIEIEKFARNAADAAVYFLENADMNAYKRFLNEMYHYTRYSGTKLQIAYEQIDEPEVKSLFKEFFDDEELHYRLAHKDLEAFGLKPTNTQSKNIDALDQLWMSMAEKPYVARLAIMFVFENIAKYVQSDVLAFADRLGLAEETNARWLLTHSTADIEHGKKIRQILIKHIGHNPSVVVSSALEASSLWSKMMIDLIDDGRDAVKKAA